MQCGLRDGAVRTSHTTLTTHGDIVLYSLVSEARSAVRPTVRSVRRCGLRNGAFRTSHIAHTGRTARVFILRSKERQKANTTRILKFSVWNVTRAFLSSFSVIPGTFESMSVTRQKALYYEQLLDDCFGCKCKFCGQEMPESLSKKGWLEHVTSCNELDEKRPDLAK